MMEDILRLAVANMHPSWGDKESNVAKISSFMQQAKDKGVQMLLLPEMCLTGYDDPEGTPYQDKMPIRQAEPIPGPVTEQLAVIASELDLWLVFGMPEQADNGCVFNSAVIISPQGIVGSYRKIHLPNREPEWAHPGDKPMVFQTPWGPIGVGICYDVYNFPEMIQYASAKGARLFLNPTAICWDWFSPEVFRKKLESDSLRANILIASSNLVGKDQYITYTGCSNILAPTGPKGDVEYLAGHPFSDAAVETEGLFVASLDLSVVQHQKINSLKNLFDTNRLTGYPDWRPDLYARWYDEIADSDEWKSRNVWN